jgi:Flp pilus assembly protein TadG
MTPIRFGRQGGNAIVEFALSVWVLCSLFIGVYEFGYRFYAYNLLEVSVANAAQLGATMNYDIASPSTLTTKIQNMAVYGDINGGTKPLVSGITTGNVSVNYNLDANGFPHDVTVSMTGYKLDALFQKFTMPNKPRVTALYTGQVSCSTC